MNTYFVVEATDGKTNYYLLAEHWSRSSFVGALYRATFYANEKEARETLKDTQIYKDYKYELNFNVIPVEIKRNIP